MKLHEIALACQGEILQGEDVEITQVSNDTRTIQPGALYVPLRGEVFDGHTFIEQAFQKGAVVALTSRRDIQAAGALIYVQDTLQALQDLARYQIKKAAVPVVAVTGSVGKTSTRDMIGAVVQAKYKTLKTEGNFNNHIGLPLTILRYQDEEAMVLEMGMNHLGEIRLLTNIAKPQVAVITNVGTAHIGLLGSRKKILEAKLEIAEGLDEKGILLINHDNDLLSAFYEDAQNHAPGYQIQTFGIEKESDFQAESIELFENGSRFICHGIRYTVPVPGMHFILNALSAIAVGYALGIEPELIRQAIANFELTRNRMDIEMLGNHIQVIDGTYNANLDSMLSSLAVLGRYRQRKIAVLADMLELGEYSDELHLKTGQAVDREKIDLLICVGPAAKMIMAGAEQTQDKHWFSSNGAALDYLKQRIQKDDVILVKGSNSMHLKEIVKGLKESYGYE